MTARVRASRTAARRTALTVPSSLRYRIRCPGGRLRLSGLNRTCSAGPTQEIRKTAGRSGPGRRRARLGVLGDRRGGSVPVGRAAVARGARRGTGRAVGVGGGASCARRREVYGGTVGQRAVPVRWMPEKVRLSWLVLPWKALSAVSGSEMVKTRRSVPPGFRPAALVTGKFPTTGPDAMVRCVPEQV